MNGRATSYTGEGRRGQSPVWRCLAVALLASGLGGCAGMGLPFGDLDASRAAQGRTAKPTLASAAAVDPSDWETIRRSVAGASETDAHRLSWINPDTGSNGTIGVAPATEASGTLCRPFATTINDMRGVRRYRGDACLRTDGRWQLHGISADDVLLS